VEKKHKVAWLVFLIALAGVSLNDQGVINITGNTIKCIEGPLDNYRCYPLDAESPYILQREYQYENCQHTYFNLETCSNGETCNRVTKQCS
jgi:hypothetical protein|tara:strand:- start:458 stop:730 length:273 start_codon:yes stop_codon:yes gene_type:complete